jgi:hypothetical protein
MKVSITEALQEGNWSAAAWNPRIAGDAEFQVFVAALIGRASAYVEWRVGTFHYTDPAEPKASVLKEAEMHLCQEQLLLSAAEVADAAADAASPPFLASGEELREQARHRRERAEELLAPYDQGFQRGFARPAARSGASTPPLADYRFDELLGRVPALC